MKTCPKCNETKALQMFGKNKSRKDGLQCWCKECRCPYNKLWYAANSENIKAWHKENYKVNKEQVQARNSRWERSNPEKVLAKHNRYFSKLSLVNQNVSRRTLAAWSLQARATHPYCELCLTTESLEAHHILPKAKYPQFALDLINAQILCTDCHDDVHSEIINLGNEEGE